MTVHRINEAKGWPKDTSEGIGEECQVLFGKKLYSGVVAALGEVSSCSYSNNDTRDSNFACYTYSKPS